VPVDDDNSGEFILVEADRRDVGDAVELAADATGREIARASETLAGAFDQIGPALSMMILKLRSATHAPDDVEVKFGLKLGAETGLIFAKGTAEATFDVTVKWSKPSGPPTASNAAHTAAHTHGSA
jgi:hypothetical protein